jgi:hypothetical protein
MGEHDNDIVEQMHREAVRRHWEDEERGRGLVEQVHRAEAERLRHEQLIADQLIEQMHRAAVQEPSQHLTPSAEALTLHCTELPDARADSTLRYEWHFYRREVGRLLAEGHAGQHVLIKGEQVVGLWDTHDDAMQAGYQRFAGQPFLVHRVQECERVLRCVSVWQWRNLRFRSPASS